MNMDALGAIFSPDVKRALDWVPAMIWVAGPDGDCRDVNRAWQAFTGRKREDALGDGWLSMMHPEDAAAWQGLLAEAIRDATPFALECRLRRRDGRYRWLLKNGQPVISDQGKCIGFVGYCSDVSAQKRALESLDQAGQKHRSVLANLREAVSVIEGFLHTADPLPKRIRTTA